LKKTDKKRKKEEKSIGFQNALLNDKLLHSPCRELKCAAPFFFCVLLIFFNNIASIALLI